MNKFVVRKLSMVVVISLLGACSNTKQQNFSNIDVNYSKLDIYIDLETVGEVNVILTEPGYDGDQLATSIYSANFNAAMNGAQSSPGGNITGALLVAGMARSMAVEAATRQKNKPVDSFLNHLSSLHWIRDVGAKSLGSTKKSGAGPYIVLSPKVSLSSDYRSLLVNYTIEVKSPGSNILYKNYITLESQPVLGANRTITDLNSFKKPQILPYLKESYATATSLLRNVLFHQASTPSENKAVRFRNQRGEFYIRGQIIKPCDGYIIYKTLRQELGFAPCIKN